MSLETLFSLKGKTALVVGASRGIGLAIAKEIAAAGAHTVLAARSADKLAEEVAALRAQGYSADSRSIDMTNSESIQTFAAEFRGKTDILINVAGTNVRRRMQDYTKEEYNRILDTNLHGIFELCQHIGGGMVEAGKGGKIIHIGSLMSLLGIPFLSVSAISKAGIASLARFEAGGWFGIFIPSSTPEALQQRLAQDIRSVLEQRDTREAIARTGTDPRILMRAEFAAYLQSELERWTPVIRSRNIKPD